MSSSASASAGSIATDVIAAKVRQILKDHGRLGTDADTLSSADNLVSAGMTSHANVNVMLALENEFDIEFPDHMLKRSTFESIGSISRAVASLLPSA